MEDDFAQQFGKALLRIDDGGLEVQEKLGTGSWRHSDACLSNISFCGFGFGRVEFFGGVSEAGVQKLETCILEGFLLKRNIFFLGLPWS